MAHRSKVLVIDDDLDMCDIIASTAAGLGMECIITTDAGSFFRALTSDVNLIMLDLLMPDTDGIEILRTLGQKRCQAGIVVMSGVGKRVMQTAEELASALGLSIVGHLAKPFSAAKLEDMLLRNPTPAESAAPTSPRHRPFERAEILLALQEEQFVLHYQPKIEIATGACVGIEVLARWQHPVHGLVFPDNFIGLIEDLGLVNQLTWIVIKMGLAEMRDLADDAGDRLSLSFNVSVLSLRDLNFPDKLIALLPHFDARPEQVILEITETCLIRELSQTLDVLTRLRIKGFRLSIDDFGTGYSMMEQLRHIPANELKIDKSLLQNLQADNHRVFVQKIIELARELDVISVAEGVETREQLDFLQANACDIAQGYFFSRPVSRPNFLAWFKAYQANLKTSFVSPV